MLIIPFLAVLCAVAIVAVISAVQGKAVWLERKTTDFTLFLLSITSLFFSLRLFINTVNYIDDAPYPGTDLLAGGPFLMMMLLEFPILFCLSLILLCRVVRRRNKS